MKKSYAVLAAAALLFVMSIVTTVSGVETGAGSADDPVVTKSYVDQVVAQLKNDMGSVSPSSSASGSFKVVEVQAGESVIGKEGTEIVLRGGSATAIDNGADGVSDLTSGTDVKSPTAIVKNHLLLVPRTDGRGIKCSTHAWVMVKGDYEIK